MERRCTKPSPSNVAAEELIPSMFNQNPEMELKSTTPARSTARRRSLVVAMAITLLVLTLSSPADSSRLLKSDIASSLSSVRGAELESAGQAAPSGSLSNSNSRLLRGNELYPLASGPSRKGNGH